MKHHEKVKFVSAARFKIDHIHNAVGLLQQVEGSLVLLTLDEAVSAVVQLSEHDRDFVLRDTKLLIVVLVEGVVLIDGALCWVSVFTFLLCSTYGRCLASHGRP